MNGNYRYLPLCVLLALTFAVEILAAWSASAGISFVRSYHLFVVIEYALLCIYFTRVSKPAYRKYIYGSIPAFAILSLFISWKLYLFGSFPGLNIDLEGMLVSVICASVLFNLDSTKYRSIGNHPDFWISCGLLVFYTGTFFSNGLYTYLLSMDRDQAIQLFSIVNKPLNVILYSCLIVGCLCAMPRKSSTQLS